MGSNPMYPIFKAIFWVFVLLLAFSFFGISIQSVIHSPAGQENFGYALNLLTQAWDWLAHFVRNIP